MKENSDEREDEADDDEPCMLKRIKASVLESIVKNLLARARETAIKARHSLKMT